VQELVPQHAHSRGFEHEALLYAGDDEFVDRTAAFVREGVEADEPVLVMVGARKLERLRAAIGDHAERVRFVDMEQAGRNPAWIIPAWRDFANQNARPGRSLRGVGEPIWADRSTAELVECQTHESLLNVAFADADGFRLLCPYDTSALEAAVIEEARRSHPIVSDGDVRWSSASYRSEEAAVAGLDKPLPDPAPEAREVGFDPETLSSLRTLVRGEAESAGFKRSRAEDFALAVSEAAANSVRHAGGHGTLLLWREPAAFVAELRDAGSIDDPMVGRVEPAAHPDGGQGLWLANHLCDLVQVRSFPDGTRVRLHIRA
jgi:anti-sigma regulatory factor (Ser/Thr protein kinase)